MKTKEGYSKIRRRVIVPLICAFVFLIGLLIYEAYRHETAETNAGVELKITEVSRLLKGDLEEDSVLLGSLIRLVTNDEKIQKAWIAKDREALREQATPLFNKIHSDYKVTHFYFIDLDGKCFLRVHNPMKHGDTIDPAHNETSKVNRRFVVWY